MALVKSWQIRAARELLGWKQSRLADAAGVSPATLRKMELSERGIPGRHETVRLVQTTLEAAGVEFLGDGDGVGVRERAGLAAPKA